MTPDEYLDALRAAARAGDAEAKAFLPMWYANRATRPIEDSGDPIQPQVEQCP